MSVKIFSGRSTQYLSEKIIKQYYKDEDAKLNDVDITQFKDQEINIHFKESIRQDKVFIIQSTALGSDNIMELFLMIDSAKRASARQITVVIPYFGYARQDRKDKPRVPISAKMMADLLTTAGATRIVSIDLHADQIQGFFNIPVDHLSSGHIFVPYIRNNFNLENVVIASPDAGGGKRASRYAHSLETDMVICHKERRKPGEISMMKLIGDVNGKDVFIVDDMIDSAGSITRAANLIMEQGANSVRALCTHPILSSGAYNKINNSALSEVVVTDTIPIKEGLSDKIKVLSVDNMIAKAIKLIVNGKSLSEDLFGTL
jgi:ribose-phosphate pyrophosphokinase